MCRFILVSVREWTENCVGLKLLGESKSRVLMLGIDDPSVISREGTMVADGNVVLPVSKRYHRHAYHMVKRVFDLVAASLGLIILFPVFLIVSIMVALSGGLPVMFKQQRVGYRGKPFFIYKFRTMVRNAEQILKDRPELLEEYRKNFKIEHDPRISKVGNFLRRSSLDELPQLLNVIKGDMSLVGPRPIVIPELTKYGDDQEMYMAMRPGCTGLWQCGGRSATTYEERVALDKEYFQRAGLRFDLYIIFKTVFAIFSARGAR